MHSVDAVPAQEQSMLTNITRFETSRSEGPIIEIHQHDPEVIGTPLDFKSITSAWQHAAMLTLIARSRSPRITSLQLPPDAGRHKRRRANKRRAQSGNVVVRQIHDALHTIALLPMFHGRNEWIASLESSSPEKHSMVDTSLDLFHFHVLYKTTPMILGSLRNYRSNITPYFSQIGSIHLERCGLSAASIERIEPYLHKSDRCAMQLAGMAFPGSRSKTFFQAANINCSPSRSAFIANWDASYKLRDCAGWPFRLSNLPNPETHHHPAPHSFSFH
jgi:hypothetical protein